MTKKIHLLRREYSGKPLSYKNTAKTPFNLFNVWFSEAIAAKIVDPNAMTLATSWKNGKPSARIVLLKEYSENGFSFFTNYGGKKSRQINENPSASLLFYWAELNRQVRIEGIIKKLADKESDEYFASRPRESQISALISQQSDELKDRKDLDDKFKMTAEKFHNKEIPRPKDWGGFILIPDYFEFWQGRENRLHDRVSYQLENNLWTLKLLYP